MTTSSAATWSSAGARAGWAQELQACRIFFWPLLVLPPYPLPHPHWKCLHFVHPPCQKDAGSSNGTPSAPYSPRQTSGDHSQLLLKNSMWMFSWSFIFRLEKQWVIRWIIRSTLHKTLMWVIRLLDSIFQGNNCGSSCGSSKKWQNLPAALKWLLPLYMITMSASSILRSCLILYSCRVLVLSTFILALHIQDTANRTALSPQKSLWSKKCRYCLKDKGGVHPPTCPASTSTP